MKKNKYYGRDDDFDGLDDGYEVDTFRHSKDNKPRHISVGGSLPNKGGIIGIHHDSLTSNIGRGGKLTMNEPKKMKITMKEPKKIKMSGMKEIKVPKAELKGDVKNFGIKFQEDYLNEKISAILGKKKKKVNLF